jgi:hypothetical protein
MESKSVKSKLNLVYRGADEPYWTYGYVNLLTKKPKSK